MTVSAPTDASTSSFDACKGKGKGQGKDAVKGKGKSKGNGNVNSPEGTSIDEGWAVIQRKGKAESKPWTLGQMIGTPLGSILVTWEASSTSLR